MAKFRGCDQSFEREYYDLIRGGFLKYIMQMKIGQMQGAAIAYHNTQKIFGFQYIKLEEMEKRIFGSPQFSNIVFKSSLAMLEKILDYIIDDQDSQRFVRKMNPNAKLREEKKVFKLGFYANHSSNRLTVMVELFDNNDVYMNRINNIMPEYIKDPVDYYRKNDIQPHVIKYEVSVYPIHNSINVQQSTILFEEGDDLEIKYSIQRIGPIEFNEYMMFLHEAYKADNNNIVNDYLGIWTVR